MKKILICIAIIGAVCLIAVVIVISLSIDSIVKKGVETVGPQITKTEMKLDGASISVMSGAGTLKGFFLGNPEGYKTPSAIKVGEIGLGVKPGSLLSDKIHVTHVKVLAPEITFEGTMGTDNNLSKILQNVDSVAGGSKEGDKTKPKPAEGGASKKLQVDDFLISNAKVNVSMTMLGGQAATLTIPDIHFANLGTGPEGITAAELTKQVLDKVTVETLKAVQKAAADLSKSATDAVKEATKSSTNILDKTKGVGDILKKKEPAAK